MTRPPQKKCATKCGRATKSAKEGGGEKEGRRRRRGLPLSLLLHRRLLLVVVLIVFAAVARGGSRLLSSVNWAGQQREESSTSRMTTKSTTRNSMRTTTLSRSNGMEAGRRRGANPVKSKPVHGRGSEWMEPDVATGTPSAAAAPPQLLELPNELRDVVPRRTVPPPSIPLQIRGEERGGGDNDDDDVVSRAIRSRHQCLAAIRDRHVRVLGPYVLGGHDNSNQKSSTPEILLVDPAYHKNVGDHMITLGEHEFLRTTIIRDEQMTMDVERDTAQSGLDAFMHECGYVQSGTYSESCDIYLNNRTQHGSSSTQPRRNRRIAMWHGGGNWGDLWRTLHPIRIDSFQAILQHDYTIIGMPQSLYYRDETRAREDAQLLRESTARGLASQVHSGASDSALLANTSAAKSRIVLCWREVESLQQAELLYPFATHVLVPDIAFQLGPYERPKVEVPLLDVVLLLRDDHESTNQEYRSKAAIRALLAEIPEAERLTFRIVDWDDRLELFESNNIFFSETSIQLLAMGRVVICDRLHAAILCYLSGIPFVYVDPVTGKITKTLRVAFDSAPTCRDSAAGMWSRADNVTHALRTAFDFINKYKLR